MRSEAGSFLVTLEQFAPALIADAHSALHPFVDGNGTLLKPQELIAQSERAVRLSKQIAEFAVASDVYKPSINTLLPKLYLALDGFASAMERVVVCAKTLPATLEDYHILLGPLHAKLELAVQQLEAMLNGVLRVPLARDF
jgi:hypothetical protein